MAGANKLKNWPQPLNASSKTKHSVKNGSIHGLTLKTRKLNAVRNQVKTRIQSG
jgi:hypothetical protein